MRSVLFPTDFSNDSKQAFKFMKMFVQKMNAKLTIMNAFLDSNSPRRFRLEEGTMHQQTDRRLRRFVQSEFHDESLENIRIKSDEGNPVNAIIELSKGMSYDLVAMGGSKDFGWFAQILGGRTAKTSRLAFSPILIIPQSEKYRMPKNIMFVGNPSEANTLTINNRMQKVITALNANIYVHHSPNPSYVLNKRKNWLAILGKRFSLKARNRNAVMMKKIQAANIEMLVYRLEDKNILEQLLDYYYVVQKTLNKGIPVIVINDRTYKRL